MAEKQTVRKATTPVARVCFPNVFRKNEKSGKYQLDLVFDKKADLSELKKMAQEAAKEYFGDTLPKNIRSPFKFEPRKNQTTGEIYAGYDDMACYITVRSDSQPGVVDASLQEIIDEQDFYGGCYARATVTCFAYGGKKKGYVPGISFGLQNIQKLKDGEPFSKLKKAKACDDFEAFSDASDNPENYSNDELPF